MLFVFFFGEGVGRAVDFRLAPWTGLRKARSSTRERTNVTAYCAPSKACFLCFDWGLVGGSRSLEHPSRPIGVGSFPRWVRTIGVFRIADHVIVREKCFVQKGFVARRPKERRETPSFRRIGSNAPRDGSFDASFGVLVR